MLVHRNSLFFFFCPIITDGRYDRGSETYMRTLLLSAVGLRDVFLLSDGLQPTSRRSALLGGCAALLAGTPAPCDGAVRERGGVQWTVALPEEYSVSRQLESVVRVRVEQASSRESVPRWRRT